MHILTGMCAGLHRVRLAGHHRRQDAVHGRRDGRRDLERDLIRERTLDGLRAAQAQGRHGGRPRTVDDDVLAIARNRRGRGESVTTIARHLGVGRSTLYRALDVEHTGAAT
jgi:DNA invertase Pin-like site-specific DNA recombinase